MMDDASAHIRAIIPEVVRLVDEAFDAAGHRPQAGTSLDQVDLLGGEHVVSDYIEHGEPGLALDHLMYMIEEPPLSISHSAYEHLEAAALAMGMPLSRLHSVRPVY